MPTVLGPAPSDPRRLGNLLAALALAGCSLRDEGRRHVPLAELRAQDLSVSFDGCDNNVCFAVELSTAPPEGCLSSLPLTATLDGASLGEAWTADHAGSDPGCGFYRWTERKDMVPRGPGDRRVEITDGRTTLGLTIEDPFVARRLVPTGKLGVLAPQGWIHFDLLSSVAIVRGGGGAVLSPAHGKRGDAAQLAATTVLVDRGVEVLLPEGIAAGEWQLVVRLPVEIPVACPVQTCRVSAVARFMHTVTIGE